MKQLWVFVVLCLALSSAQAQSYTSLGRSAADPAPAFGSDPWVLRMPNQEHRQPMASSRSAQQRLDAQAQREEIDRRNSLGPMRQRGAGHGELAEAQQTSADPGKPALSRQAAVQTDDKVPTVYPRPCFVDVLGYLNCY